MLANARPRPHPIQMLIDNTTIAAIATPIGTGGIGIIRISGPKVPNIAHAMIGTLPPPRYAHYAAFKDGKGDTLDYGLALFFPAPHSFTGEDVLELQGHGGLIVMQLVLRQVLTLGVRAATAGEFSQRAFLNNRLDLTQAEAIADLIDSSSELAARSALRSLQGAFSSQINQLLQQLTELRLYVEAAIDFPEEELDFLGDGRIAAELAGLLTTLTQVWQAAQQGQLLREGMTLVLAGRPNVGKSSLLNQLAGQDLAIVTAIPGTTRDCLHHHLQLDGLPLHIIDTAGLRATTDPIEQEGIRRTWNAIHQANRILLVSDGQDAAGDNQILAQLPPLPVTRVHNKIDLLALPAHLSTTQQDTQIWLSAKTGDGLALLYAHLKQSLGYCEHSAGVFMARERHVQALHQAHNLLLQAQHQFQTAMAGELLAEDLRQAHAVLGTITGAVSSDELLGMIFSRFCIGK